MASYPRIVPATLANWSPVINDPTGAEDANKVNEVDLQTRRFIYDFLTARFDSSASDVLKPASVADTTLAGKVKGSTSNAGTQQAIVQGTVSTPDLRDSAVSTAKIAPGAVTTGELATGAVTTVKIADAPNGVGAGKVNDAAIGTAQLINDAVDATKLKDSASVDSDRAVTSDHIRDSSVTSAKIAANAVTGAKLVAGSSGQILVASSGGVVTVAWVKEYETVTSLVTIGASGKISLAAGTYIIEVTVPGYKVDEHIARLARYNSSDVLQETAYGTSEMSTAAAVVQTSSSILAKMAFAASDYFKVEHWTKTANATDGMGHPSSSGGTYEVYTQIRIQRIA